MTKKVQITQYQCSRCKELFDSKKDAIECERRNLKDKFTKDKEKVFPTWVYSKKKDGTWDENEDSRYTFHCVVCGKVLIKYDTYWDGHRNNPGDLEYQGEYSIIKGAKVCPDCQTIQILLDRLEKLRAVETQYEIDLAQIR